MQSDSIIESITHLPQCHGHSCNCVHMGASLEGGEDCSVDLLLKVIFDLLALFVCPLDSTPEEDEATPVHILRGGKEVWVGRRSERGRERR